MWTYLVSGGVKLLLWAHLTILQPLPTYTRSSSWVPTFKDIASIYCDVQVQFGRGLTTVVGPRMLPWRIILSISWFLCHVEFRHLCHLRISALSGQFWYCPDGFNTVRTEYSPDIFNTVQLFETGSWRNIKSHFGAFNLQWALLSNWNPWLKYLSTFHFLTKMAEIFCGVKGDAKADRNNFLEKSRHSKKARKRLETEKMWILGHF